MFLNLGVFEPRTQSMGPGIRACIWVKGCSISCNGCGTPELIPPLPSRFVHVNEIVAMIREAKEKHDIEGISFSGGEPFEQAEALAHIAHEARAIGLSTLSWSGYTRKFLESIRAPRESQFLIHELDVLIDGAFSKRLSHKNLPLRGSSNQVIHRLTGRYTTDDFSSSTVSMKVGKDGIQIVGIMDYELGKAILSLVGTL